MQATTYNLMIILIVASLVGILIVIFVKHRVAGLKRPSNRRGVPKFTSPPPPPSPDSVPPSPQPKSSIPSFKLNTFRMSTKIMSLVIFIVVVISFVLAYYFKIEAVLGFFQIVGVVASWVAIKFIKDEVDKR